MPFASGAKRSSVRGPGVLAISPLLGVFHIYALNVDCTRHGGILDFRSNAAGFGPDLIGSEDTFFYCYLPYNGDA
jgi:hypothetical protein